MAIRSQKTKLVRVYVTREHIFVADGEMVLEVPYDLTSDEIADLDVDGLVGVPWRRWSEPVYANDPEADFVMITSVDLSPTNVIDIDGVITRTEDGNVVVAPW